MKIAAYIILMVVAVLTGAAIVSALMMAIQIVAYAVVAGLVLWLVIAVAKYFTDNKDKPPS